MTGKTVGFLGCGKIGKAMLRHLATGGQNTIAFIQDPDFVNDCDAKCPVVSRYDEAVCKADLVVECATPNVLKIDLANYLRTSDLLVFSLSAFGEAEFEKEALDISLCNRRRIYVPHGAILGLDGIFDARSIISAVEIETVKSPKTLDLKNAQRTVVYDGDTRGAVAMFPRNANVHAAIALAGIGFDRTRSTFISDPAVSTNSHIVHVSGEGINFRLDISSFATGGVTGSYTPISACGSLDRVLGRDLNPIFV